MKMALHEDGSILSLCFQETSVPFRQDGYKGFSFYTVQQGRSKGILLHKEGENRFCGHDIHRRYELSYRQEGEELLVTASVENQDAVSYKPTTLGLRLGIDCYMESYPEWNDLYFPTLLRCEKTHFWGYFMTPKGKILTIACEDPIASWSLSYNELTEEEAGAAYLTGGHRIYTANLHLVNRPPRPERHPRLDEIPPHTKMVWNFRLRMVPDLESVPIAAAQMAKAPMFSLKRYTLDAGDMVSGICMGEISRLTCVSPDGERKEVPILEGGFRFACPHGIGRYRLLAENRQGKCSEASFYCKQPNTWYLEQARRAVLEMPPVHTHHLESFNCLFSILLAKKYLPDEKKDGICERYFTDFVRWLYDEKTQTAAHAPWRIQDSAGLACLLSMKYEQDGTIEYLRMAAHLADYLITCQAEDGAYYSIPAPGHKTHYTAVTYIAKYVMDTAKVEEKASQKYPEFAAYASRHRASALRAVANLEQNRDNIDTEGELTFEDGMISCSMLQIAAAALEMETGERRERYLKSAEYMYRLHRCLTQSVIPDCRMNGATLRFWEAQYNVNLFSNMMNSPCGWSAWKVYGDYYLYLLTGKGEYLHEAMNGLGACLQLVDGQTGRLRWGFICDPYIETSAYIQEAPGLCRGKIADLVLGEEYVEMVSGWHRTEKFPREKWGIDQLVHEIFKCMAEITLTNVYLLEEDDGSLTCYNGIVEEDAGTLRIHPREAVVQHAHVQLKTKRKVAICIGKEERAAVLSSGWLA